MIAEGQIVLFRFPQTDRQAWIHSTSPGPDPSPNEGLRLAALIGSLTGAFRFEDHGMKVSVEAGLHRPTGIRTVGKFGDPFTAPSSVEQCEPCTPRLKHSGAAAPAAGHRQGFGQASLAVEKERFSETPQILEAEGE